jgi:DNA polymerase-1
MELDWEGWRLRDWDAPRLLALFRDWGFRTFADMVRSSSSVVHGPEPETSDNGQPTKEYVQGELFPFGANAEPEGETLPSTTDNGQRITDNWQANYHLVDTPEKFQSFYQQLGQQKRIAVDLETTGLDPLRCEMVGYAFCWQPGEGQPEHQVRSAGTAPPRRDPGGNRQRLDGGRLSLACRRAQP